MVSNSTSYCTVSGSTVTFVAVGTCSLTASVAETTDYTAASGSPQTFTIGQATPTVSISNIPASGTAIYGGSFTPTYTVTSGDAGTTSVVSDTATTCTVTSGVVSYVGVGTCTLTASVAATANYAAGTGSDQSFSIGKATPTAPTISDIPANPAYQENFAATVSTTGDGTTSVVSSTTGVCTVNGLTVTFVGVGTCSLTASVASGTDYTALGWNRAGVHGLCPFPVDADHHEHSVERHSGRHVCRQRQHER